jgi:cell division protein FtsQ
LVLAIVALTAAYAAYRGGTWLVYDVVLKSPSFAVKTIDVRTDGVASNDELTRWSGIERGANLWALNLEQIRRDLELNPWVRAASVQRIPPHSLKIRVAERRVLARLRVPYVRPTPPHVRYASYYLDRDGWVIYLDDRTAAAESARRLSNLPRLLGLQFEEIRPGRSTDRPKVIAAMRLIEEFRRSPMVGRVKVESVDVSVPWGLTVTTSEGTRVTFGLDRLTRQLQIWRRIHDHGLTQGKRILTLDLSIRNYHPVVWSPIRRLSEPARRENVTGNSQRHV